MGINPTPTNHRSFTFDGKSTREFGVYITGKDVFNSPERAVEMISIPGRDGEYALDQGHFNNIEVTYRAGIVADSTTDFAEAISNFRNWLASREGYCRLTDEYNTEEYRMAVFKNAIALEHEGLLTGEFDVTFDCKPQRYLAIGEELTEIGAWGNTETAEGEIVTIDASSDTAVKALTADISPIQDLNGYDAPWVGGAGKNKLQQSWTSPLTHNGVTFTRNSDGSVTATGATSDSTDAQCSIEFSLPVGNYYFTGCANGGSQSTTNTWNVYMWNQTAGARIKKWNGSTNTDTCVNNTQFYEMQIPNTTDSFRYTLRVMKGTTLPTNGITFYPMICASTETDAIYEPYSNVCPISGRNEVGVSVVGKNLAQFRAINSTWSGITMRTNGSSITISGTATANASPWSGTAVSTYETMKNGPFPAGTYTLSCRGFEMQVVNDRIIAQAKYADGSSVSGMNDTRITPSTVGGSPNDKTFTATEPFKMDFWLNIQQGSVCDFTATIQLELGSTATDYEPYTEQSYTTPLGQTVYGGTLDVVSGLLTVNRKIVTLNGTENIISTSNNRFFVNYADAVEVNTSNQTTYKGVMCDRLASDTWAGLVYNSGVCGPVWGKGISFRLDSITTVDGWKTYFANNPTQFCYELATPQTYQLTPQQVELLLGENHVFADSGNVTVEYGHNPTLLTNPTWFPSKPLVYAKGYGDINLGNRTITVSDEPIGEVLLANKIDRNTSNRSYFDTATLALLNVGDTITVSSGSQLIIGLASSSTSTTITSITATVTGGTAQAIGAPSTYVDRYSDGRIEITMDAFDFANGTTEKATVELDVTVNYKENGTTKSWSSTEFVAGYRYSVVYNAVSFAGFEVEPSLPDDIYSYIPRDATIENIYGYSTKQITADGYYIDLDMGEAYTMVDGVPSSINNLVTMPSDLPTLPSGDTEVTYDNTITKVEVKPNWWKV